MGGGTGNEPDATRSLAPAAASTGGHTAATAMLSEPGAPSARALDPEDDGGAPGDPAITLAPGEAVGRFLVVSTLGAGGMGVVHAAYDPELDRKVAIKLLHQRERSREANLRLLREAQAMARLSHPNVVSVFDVGELDRRTVFLAMEYVDGLTLKAWREAAPRSWREIRDVLVQAGRGLAAAHRSGLVHRDFKPGNLLVDRDGRAKVTDFGIARLRDDQDDGIADAAPGDAHASGVTPLAIDLTRTGTAIGTPAYMAPEQHRGQPVDARADQFAFCVTAWEALYGERPFAGKGPDLLRAIGAGAIATPPAGRSVPPWIAPLLRRGLADAPGDRWPALDALLDRLADDPAARRRRRVVAAATLVAVAALAAGVSYVATADDRDACAGTGQELAAAWNPTARAAAEAAFRATGSPLAADHWARVAARLDAWTGTWKAARRDACEQHVRRAQTADLHDRRVECLLRGRGRLVALVDLLRAADATIVRESVMAAASLPAAEDCGDPESLLAQRAVPSDPALRATLTGFNDEIERANTLRLFGRYPAALAIIQDLRARAAKIDYPALTADLTFGIGMLQTDTSDPAAEATLREAADLAAIARDTTLYARVWLQLVWEVGAKRARYDDGVVLGKLAWQAVHLAGDSPGLVAGAHQNEGGMLYAHGDHAAAAAAIERALAIVEKQRGKDSVHLVAPLNLLAVSIGSRDPERAAALYRRALAILEKEVSPSHPRVGAILGNLGGIAMAAGKFEESAEHHRRSLAIVEAALGADAPDLGPSLNGLAQPLWALGRYDEAFALIERARTLWEKKLGSDHPHVAAALTNLGGLRNEQGRCAEAVPYLEQARAIHDKVLPPDHPSRATTLLFHGACLVDLGKPAQAIPLLERSIAIYEAKSAPSQQAGPRFELARAKWELGDKKTALAMAEAAREVLAADPADQAQIAAGVESGSQQITEWLRGKTGR